MEENVIAGLVSGVVVSIFVVAFGKFWNNIIIPWFEDRVYKDARIEGKWFSIYTNGMALRQEVIILKRHGHYIQGSVIATNGLDEGEEYKVHGSFRNLILPLTYENTDKSSTDRGTITLKSHRNGKRFSGMVSHYSAPQDAISNTEVFWFRDRKYVELKLKELESELQNVDDVSRSYDSLTVDDLADNNKVERAQEEPPNKKINKDT